MEYTPSLNASIQPGSVTEAQRASCREPHVEDPWLTATGAAARASRARRSAALAREAVRRSVLPELRRCGLDLQGEVLEHAFEQRWRPAADGDPEEVVRSAEGEVET